MRRWLAVALLAVPGVAQAQAYRCIVPQRVDRPHPDEPSADQPRRLLPIGGYTLAVTWGPEYCRGHARDAGARVQCGGGNRFGFTLHGLWPDGVGRDWPQYCRTVTLLPPQVIRGALCATPSAQLLQHEWAKHGTCMSRMTPERYFGRSTGLYERLRFPDMDALSRQPITADALARAIATANPELPAEAVRVTTNRQGWLDELWLCLDTGFKYARCRAGSGGVAGGTAVKIWRGRR